MREKPTPLRHLTLDHLVFYRAWMEGVGDLGALAERYLETGASRPAAKRTLRIVQNALIAAATRAGRHGQARLLRLDQAALRASPPLAGSGSAPPSSTTPAIPTFESFSAEKDPEGNFSTEELWEIYHAEFETPTLDETPEQGGRAAQDPKQKQAERRLERNGRLAQKRQQLIAALTPELIRPPRLEDDISVWFDETVTLPLTRMKIATLGHVVDLANTLGYHWEKRIPKFGPVRAKRLVAWLSKHHQELGVTIAPFVTVPRHKLPKPRYGFRPDYLPATPQQTDNLVPALYPPSDLGMFCPPSELDGSQGLNRAPAEWNKITRNGVRAGNDYQAILSWLDLYNGPQHQHTQRNYRTIAERLLLWSVFEKRLPISSLGANDLEEFLEWLKDPQPHDRWVSDRTYSRVSPMWRPFVSRRLPKAHRYAVGPGITLPIGPQIDLVLNRDGRVVPPEEERQIGLSRASVKQTATVLKSLFNWLEKMRYLDFNAFEGLPLDISQRPRLKVEHSLTEKQWQFLLKVASELPEDDKRTPRIRFALHFAYATGMRLSEMIMATTSHCEVKVVDTDEDGNERREMLLNVLGKGGKERKINLPRGLVRHLGAYLISRGLPANPKLAPADTPLLAKLYETKSSLFLTPQALYTILTDFFTLAANQVPDLHLESRQYDRSTLLQASTHWLRHTSGTHALKKKGSLPVVQDRLGHADLATTSLYIHTEDVQRADEAEAFDQEMVTGILAAQTSPETRQQALNSDTPISHNEFTSPELLPSPADDADLLR